MKISRQKIELRQAEKNITASQLAELSGVSRQSISSLKTRGTCLPQTAAKLAKALGIKVTEIIE